MFHFLSLYVFISIQKIDRSMHFYFLLNCMPVSTFIKIFVAIKLCDINFGEQVIVLTLLIL